MEIFMSIHNVVKADEQVISRDVKNASNDNLGKIKEIMLDKLSGKVAYLVLESGTFLGMGGKLFAIPWNSVKYQDNDDCFILNVDKEKLKNAPGFDKDHWPDMADREYGASVFTYYGTKPYWE
jgi:sporulation protein YlmC with PRC-barrel domain